METQDGPIFHRHFRVSLAAMCGNEQRFREQVGILWFQPEMWAIMPVTCYKVSFRALAFRCISRMLCAMHEILEVPHKKFPVRLFALLEDQSLAAEFSKVPDCLLDPTSKALRDAHPDLSGEEFMHKLALLAMLLPVDIATLEAKHASIRRMLVVKSAQTHQMSFGHLAAEWVFLQMRAKQAVFAPHQRQRYVRQHLRRKLMRGKRASGVPFGLAVQNPIMRYLIFLPCI